MDCTRQASYQQHHSRRLHLERDGEEVCAEYSDYEKALQWANAAFGTDFDNESELRAYAESLGDSYCHFLHTRVLGENEQLAILPPSPKAKASISTHSTAPMPAQ